MVLQARSSFKSDFEAIKIFMTLIFLWFFYQIKYKFNSEGITGKTAFTLYILVLGDRFKFKNDFEGIDCSLSAYNNRVFFIYFSVHYRSLSSRYNTYNMEKITLNCYRNGKTTN